MEEKELLEIEAREREQARKNIEEMVRRRRIGNIELLYKDKLDLGNERACLSASRIPPLPVLIPIYEKTLFGLDRIRSPEEFLNQYGFSIEQLIEWRRKGWVETVLTAPPQHYARLSYLDDLIRVSPSNSARIQEYLTRVTGSQDKFNHLIDQGEDLFIKVKTPAFMSRLYGKRKARMVNVGNLVAYYVDLSALGLTRTTEAVEMVMRCEPDLAVDFLKISFAFLCFPFLRALRKTTVYPSQLRNLCRAVRRLAHVHPRTEEFFVPCWLADVYRNLEMTIPKKMDTDQISAVRKHSEGFVRAIRSLDEEIDKAVRERFGGGELNRGERETILAKKEEFRKRWFEDVVPAFADLSMRQKVWSIGMTGSIVAPALALPAFTGVLGIPPALAALAASDKIKKLVDPAAEFLSTFFECNPIHLGFYKVYRELKKVRRASS
jgi:hypothetical protein